MWSTALEAFGPIYQYVPNVLNNGIDNLSIHFANVQEGRINGQQLDLSRVD